jgi:hypothetical protein
MKGIFSPEHFAWAFAMMNSRHWELPIDELESHDARRPPKATPLEEVDIQQGIPPASMPTDSWVNETGKACH